jgi:cation:H+ antiporter
MSIQVVIFILSMVGLYFGAELALDAAEKIGRYFGLSPLVIGLLLIGFGTSLPEMFVSQLACIRGEPAMALGNIIGSNIANLFLIMGVAGLLNPLFILRSEIRKQLYWHFGITICLVLVIWLTGVNPISTAILSVFFGSYLWVTFSEMSKQRKLKPVDEDEDGEELTELEMSVILKLFFGFAFLYFGGEWLVSSGSKIGVLIGVPSYVISAVFVAFGTSFPELMTAMIAIYKKKNTDLITGNIIGSNIFNVAFVMGSLGFYDVPVKSSYKLEMFALLGASIFLLVLPITKKNFGRPAGALFLGVYGYIIAFWL